MDRPTRIDGSSGLQGASVLVVEDDFLIILELESILLESGARIAGLCRTVSQALQVTDRGAISVALLDVRIGGESIEPVARRLSSRGTPFVFYTGQVDTDPVLAQWPGCKVLGQPACPSMIIAALSERLEGTEPLHTQGAAPPS